MSKAWAVLIGAAVAGAVLIGTFLYGKHEGLIACQAAKVKDVQVGAKKQAAKNKRAQAVGVKTAQRQQKLNAIFRGIRWSYQDEKRKNPAVRGCVLDPVSLQLWNAANAGQQPSGPTASEFNDRMRGETSAAEAGAGRGGKPHRIGGDLLRLQNQGARLD